MDLDLSDVTAATQSRLAPTPRPRRTIRVCTDLACTAVGAARLDVSLKATPRGSGQQAAETQWLRSPCLGVCERAPAALICEAGTSEREQVLAPASASAVLWAARWGAEPSPDPTVCEAPVTDSVPQHGDPRLRLLRRIDTVNSRHLDAYQKSGGYAALRRALSLGCTGTLRELDASGLKMRDRTAVPAGLERTASTRHPAAPHVLVCGATERTPGAFKDRVLLEGDPFAVVEAMTIAAFALDCRRAHLYLRGGIPRAGRRIEHAVAEARRHGLLGQQVMGHQGFDFDIELRHDADVPILPGGPTTDVETLLNIPRILTEGAEEPVRGRQAAPGTRLFGVSGTIRRPGLYEVPLGTSMRELLGLAGGVPPRRRLRAILWGGVAGGVLRPGELDVPLASQGPRAADPTPESGAVLVLDDSVDAAGVVSRARRPRTDGT